MKFGMPTLIENNNIEETAKFQRLAEKYKIFYTIHLDEDLNVCNFNRAVTSAYLETVNRTIEAAKRLCVPVINMHMNHGIHFTLPHKKVQLFEKYNNNYMADIKVFREMCDSALEGTNIKISIENTDGYREYEKAAIEYLLESDAFTLTWDIGHSHACENIDETFILEYINKIKHFHIHDAVGKNNHLTLGTGEVDIIERLSIAEKCGASCVLETKTIDALRKSVSWLNQYKVNKEEYMNE